MSATLAPVSWPAAPVPASAADRVAAAPQRQWVLARNCSITPRQLGAVYLSLCTVSAVISAGFWWHGAPFVFAFAVVELAAFGIALLVYARHACDRDVITLAGRSVAVARHAGGRVETLEFHSDWLSVAPLAGPDALVELRGRGHAVCVGRFLRPQARCAFAHELRSALQQPAQTDSN